MPCSPKPVTAIFANFVTQPRRQRLPLHTTCGATSRAVPLHESTFPRSVAFLSPGEATGVATERSRLAIFACRPRLIFNGVELSVESTLAECGLGDGSEVEAMAKAAVVTASLDGSARIWNPETGECEKKLLGHQGPVQFASFSPDSRYVATASEDRTARLWSSVTGNCWRKLEGHADAVNAICFSPDGKLLATASEDATVRIWSVKTGVCLRILEGHKAAVYSLAFSPDASTLTSFSQDRSSKNWDVQSGVCLRTMGETPTTYTASFSPDGDFFVTAPGDPCAQITCVETGEVARLLRGHDGVVISACYAPTATNSMQRSVPASPTCRASRQPETDSPNASQPTNVTDLMQSVA